MKRGSRRGKKRYFCNTCHRSFSINHGRTKTALWIPHIDGVPFRKLGNEHGISGVQAFNRVFDELATLPDNTELTKQYCEYSSGILIVDGKYTKIKECSGKKIPWLYAIDYETHDPLLGIIADAEDEDAFLELFRTLKRLNYPLQIVVADDRTALPLALKKIYPNVPLQLCQNHYLENIRKNLHIRTDHTHAHFFTH